MIYDMEEIPLEEITIDKRTLSRTGNVEKELDELTASIKQVGLLQPIGVFPIAYKKYKLLFGFRRILAIKKLKRKTIMATIHV